MKLKGHGSSGKVYEFLPANVTVINMYAICRTHTVNHRSTEHWKQESNAVHVHHMNTYVEFSSI